MKGTVIAIDPGYDRVGIAVMKGTALAHSECFTPATKDFSGRLKAVHDRIAELIVEHRPDALALETLFFQKNLKTAIRVAEARGVIILTAAEGGIPLFEYSPQDVKMAVTGFGAARKDAVIRMVEKLVPMAKKKRQDDEYDAVALALAHQSRSRFADL